MYKCIYAMQCNVMQWYGIVWYCMSINIYIYTHMWGRHVIKHHAQLDILLGRVSKTSRNVSMCQA